jgi:hypothetical protein
MTAIAPGVNLIFRQMMPSLNFEHCRVKSHEDFPRHIYRLFLVLGIQFRWVLTRGTLARALVTQADLAIDDAKETSWMELYAPDRDTLEDILYRRLQDLWAPLTDTMKVFDTYCSAQQLCAQKVWEALLTAFPLDHKRMQTVLLAREIARMIRWDGDSKGVVNKHFASVTELHRTMGYIGNLSIEDVLKSVLMATNDDDVFYLFLQKQKIGAELHIYLEEGTYHKRLFRGPNTNDMKK